MPDAKYDAFIIRILRQVQAEFAFITPDYSDELPSDLVWVLVSALMAEKYVSVKTAAQVVHDFCVRRGNEIPLLMNGTDATGDATLPSKSWREIH